MQRGPDGERRGTRLDRTDRAGFAAALDLHEALVADLRGTGVRSTLATFAKVSSDYWSSNPGSEERVPGAQAMIRVLTPERAASALVRGIRWNLGHVIAPLELRLILAQARFFPGITRWLMQATGHRRPSIHPAVTSPPVHALRG